MVMPCKGICSDACGVTENGLDLDHTENPHPTPIAVFDSGLGGLTVVRALRSRLPAEEIVYFGDTARVPYGNKSAETVVRFALEITRFLLQLQPKRIIAACNTVSALALERLRGELPVPVLGVVHPSAERAIAATRRGLVAVLGTEATISSCAFEKAVRLRDPSVRVIQKACPLFVPLVEEGRGSDDPIVRMTIEQYLAPVKRLGPDVVLLGCTHYPILKPALAEFFGPGVELIDSGEAAADVLAADAELPRVENSVGAIHCFVSDFPPRFSAVGERFAGEPLPHVLKANAEAWFCDTAEA